jgi:hypothetical protein
MIKNVSFIIPVYNEQKRISNVYNWIKWIKRNTYNCELVLSLNGCDDGTEKIVKNIKFKCLKFYITKNKGRGYAIRKVLNKTKKKYSAICSIDNAWDKIFYIKAFEKINKKQNLFCIYGPKDHNYSKQNRIFIRRVISFFSIIFLRLLFCGKINQDTQCIKLFKNNKKFINKLKNYNYFFDTHFFLLNKTLKLKYSNIPVKINDNNKHSKVRFNSLIEFIFEAISSFLNKN